MNKEEQLDAIKTAEKTISQNNVAVLGPSSAGKTVFITLLSHALDHYFLPNTELHGHFEAGRPFLEKCEGSMIKGEFPEKTQELSRDEIVLEMSSSGATASSVKFRFPDISGENYSNMCLGVEISKEDKVIQVCNMDKDKGSQYGRMIYVIHAKMYVILIDCLKMEEEGSTLQTKYSQALTTIRDFKAVIDPSDTKIRVPIAIVLTKADTLNNNNELPKDLIKRHMMRLYNTLEDIHVGPREYFLVQVETKRNRDNEVDTEVGSKVAQPLSYSHTEYVRFLEWLHQNL